MILSSNTNWELALERLTALQGENQLVHGGANFMRAGRFRRNGQRLFTEAIQPLLAEGRTFTVVSGFIDSSIAQVIGLTEDDGFKAGADRFLIARLQDAKSGELVDVAIEEAIAVQKPL